MPARVEITLKPCRACGKRMPRKMYGRDLLLENPARYARRRYCGWWCSKHRLPPPSPRCLNCNQIIPWPLFGGARISRKRYAARVFCDRSCQRLFWLDTEHDGMLRNIRQRARRREAARRAAWAA